jgi:hypothetical protein
VNRIEPNGGVGGRLGDLLETWTGRLVVEATSERSLAIFPGLPLDAADRLWTLSNDLLEQAGYPVR